MIYVIAQVLRYTPYTDLCISTIRTEHSVKVNDLAPGHGSTSTGELIMKVFMNSCSFFLRLLFEEPFFLQHLASHYGFTRIHIFGSPFYIKYSTNRLCSAAWLNDISSSLQRGKVQLKCIICCINFPVALEITGKSFIHRTFITDFGFYTPHITKHN